MRRLCNALRQRETWSTVLGATWLVAAVAIVLGIVFDGVPL